MFPKKIGQQRRDVINIQQLIHLNSNAMKTISGSTNQNNCHRWKKYLYLVIGYRDPVCTRQCLGIHGASQCKIRYLMQNVLLHKNNFFPMGAHRFIWCHIQSNNFKNFFSFFFRQHLVIFQYFKYTCLTLFFHLHFVF